MSFASASEDRHLRKMSLKVGDYAAALNKGAIFAFRVYISSPLIQRGFPRRFGARHSAAGHFAPRCRFDARLMIRWRFPKRQRH